MGPNDSGDDAGPGATPSKKVTLVAKGGDEVNKCVCFDKMDDIANKFLCPNKFQMLNGFNHIEPYKRIENNWYFSFLFSGIGSLITKSKKLAWHIYCAIGYSCRFRFNCVFNNSAIAW